jgi:aryl-alcohol dehydrogenase-like predicted oxidoreductase
MKLVRLGGSELDVSEVCLGSMTWGQQNSRDDAHAQLDYAVSRGINFIDTAEMYSVPMRAETYGATENIIGAWLDKRGPAFRQQLIIASKCSGPSRNASDATWVRGTITAFGREDIRRGVSSSLARLHTDYLDLYQLHWPARNVPMFGGQFFDAGAERESVALAETLSALGDEVKAGRVRSIGLSNETAWGLMECLRLARPPESLPRIASVQNAFNLLNRIYENGLSEISFRENIGLLVYSPLAFGHLSGKYLAGKPANSRFALFPQFGPRYNKPGVQPAVAKYATLADSVGLTLVQLALAFCRSRSFVASTIIGATTIDQLRENIDAFSISLDAETLAAIDAIHLEVGNPAP